MSAQMLAYSQDHGDLHCNALSSVETLINEIRNGRIIIVHDARTDRGFLLGAAQMASPTMINFMAQHGRGIICLALTKQRIDELGLPMMADAASQSDRQAFTISIEARHGVTTGISAADRARTIATAVCTTDPAIEIVTPGHVFPLRASEGGVLTQAGHVEAATDLPRLAGMNPSGVICGIINDGGDDARLGDLMALADQLGLKIGSIQDVVAFRQKQDRFVHCVADMPLETRHGGEWKAKVFGSDIEQSETVVLQKGETGSGHGVLLELRSFSMLTSLLAKARGDDSLSLAMDEISGHGSGILVLAPEVRPLSLVNALSGRHGEIRLHDFDFGKTAQILKDLNVQSVKLLHHCDLIAAKLKSVGISVVI